MARSRRGMYHRHKANRKVNYIVSGYFYGNVYLLATEILFVSHLLDSENFLKKGIASGKNLCYTGTSCCRTATYRKVSILAGGGFHNMGKGEYSGFPSIDRPWLKYYSEDSLRAPLSKESLYEHIRRQNRNYGDDLAISFYDKRISYSDLFSDIDSAATSFTSIGVKAGDIVSFISITTPEILVSFYALNKIGAICNMLDPRMSESTLVSLIKKAESKHIIMLDIFSDKVDLLRSNTSLEIVLISMNGATIYQSSENKKSHCYYWDDFMRLAEGKGNASAFPYVENWPALIEYTGGTTGEPKGVLLSNDNINSVSDQYSRNGVPLRRGDIWQCVAAPFIAYVIILSTHVPLAHGVTCKISVYDPNLIANDIIRNKYNHISANPTVWEKVISSPDADNKDFSDLIMPISGADSMSIQLQKRIDQFLSNHGCKNVVCNGYGMTESGIAGCVNLSKEICKYGSVGIPFVDTCISAFTENTSEELPYNTTGEICISGPSVMLGYVNNPTATDEVLKIHSDGKVWLHTGDYGYIDEDGFVFIEGRIKRMLVKYNGAKVFPSTIETVILKNDDVEKCAVVGIPDVKNSGGQVPVAFIVVKDSHGNSLSDLERLLIIRCQQELPEYACPEHFFFVKSLPITPIGKVDYRTLEKMALQN